MKNTMDIKSLIIGFLLCLCVVLLMGFGGGSESGRYIPFGETSIIDTKTGNIRLLKKQGKWFLDTPFEKLPKTIVK